MEMRRLVNVFTNSLSIATLAVVLYLEVLITPGFSTQKQTQSNSGVNQILEETEGAVDNTSSSLWEQGWQLTQTFRPPNRGAPPTTEGTGTRTLTTSINQNTVTLLLPNLKPEESSFGLTVSEYPTFFAYIPQSSAQTGQFFLIDDNQRIVYWTSFAMPKQPGIVTIHLPANTLPPLEADRWYQWYVSVVDNPDGWENTGMSQTGWIQRIEPSASLKDQLKTATPQQLPSLYAEAGIWQDALASLVVLRRTQPDIISLMSDWQQLFNSAGLEPFSNIPLIDCCQAKN